MGQSKLNNSNVLLSEWFQCFSVFVTYQWNDNKSLLAERFQYFTGIVLQVNFFFDCVDMTCVTNISPKQRNSGIILTTKSWDYRTCFHPRTLASGITKACMSIVGVLGIIAFPPMKRVIGLHGILFFYASICMLSTIWGYIKIPETRGKSLTKVEEMYEVKK